MSESPPQEQRRQARPDKLPPLSPRLQKEITRLAILLRNATRGAWAIALYNTAAARDQVMDALRTHLHPLQVYDFTFTERRANPLAYVERLPPELRAGEQRAIIFLYDLPRGGERVWGYLEMQREALAEQPHGLVFWMTPAERGEAVQKAPNFWSQRSGVFDFTLSDERALMQTRRHWAEQPTQFVDYTDGERQIRLYQGLLEEYMQADDAPLDTVLDLHNKLFYLYDEMANYQKARQIAEAHLALAQKNEDSEGEARALNNLGKVLQDLSDLAEARACYERALHILEEVHDRGVEEAQSPNIASVINNLGRVLRALGDLAKARAYYERALRIFEAVYGPDHPNVANRVNNLGGVLRDLGDLAEARACFERALRIDEAVYGPDHPHVATFVNNLGMVLQDLGDLAAARACFERALRILEHSLPPDHPYIKTVRGNLENLADEV